MTPKDAAKSIEEKLKNASGKPVLVQRDPKCSGHASIKIASDEDSAHVLRYKPELEFDSPGGLPLGITLENILDRQNPRNRRIAEILTKCGLVERSGQGMNLIYEELIKQSKPVPDFARTDQYQFGLTLHGTIENPAFIRFVEKVGKETTAFFDAHDWMIFAAAAKGEKAPKG